MDPGVSYLVRKLKEELVKAGGKGYHALQRKFRILDDDNNNSIDFSEFKKGLNELKLGALIASEQRALFEYFDQNENGSIDFEEFIRGVRDDLSPLREGLVRNAFRRLDIDDSGTVDIDEMKLIYDVSKHPDFIDGKKTKAEILRIFMESFEGSGKDVGDGKITVEEFLNYYSNISVCVDDDEYFELMIRNAWHMSGGIGAAANSANKRVLVTHEDGSQEVVEVQNDLGVADGDSSALLRRLKQQGVEATQVTTSSGVNLMATNSKAANSNKQLFLARLKAEETSKLDRPAPMSPNSLEKARSAGRKSHSDAFSSSLGSLICGGSGGATDRREPPPQHANNVFNSANSPLKANHSAHHSSEMSHGVKALVKKLKQALCDHGARGFHGLQRKFRILDDDNNGKLSQGEFKKGINELGLAIAESEIRLLFNHFDFQNYGQIDLNTFIHALRDDLNEIRYSLVRQAFLTLDIDNNGILDENELLEKYDGSNHPDVLAGKRSEEDVLREWVAVFEVGGEVDGKVTFEEFSNYYANVSASIDDDEYFELMIRNAWHMSGGTGAAANSANKRVLVTNKDGSQSVQIVDHDIGMGGHELLRNLKKNDPNIVTFNLFGGYSDVPEAPPSPVMKKGINGRRHVEPRIDAHLATIAPVGNMSALAGVVAPALPPPAPLPAQTHARGSRGMPPLPVAGQPIKKVPLTLSVLAAAASRGVPEIMTIVRTALASRGARGIVGLSRKFRTMDDDGNGALSKAEFSKALEEMNVDVSAEELTHLFRFFDKDGSGDIDFEEFLRGVRGPLNERREAMTRMAFNKLDRNGDGVLNPDEIMKIYDASKHPDVMSGKRTTQEVLREFLETFEVGGEVDGKVTWSEFLNYYANLGVSIDNDDYFELMMRNSWRISGGDDWCANTANRRVLQTDADGTERVVETTGASANSANAVHAMDVEVQGTGAAQTLFNVRAERHRNASASTISLSDAIDTVQPASIRDHRRVTDQSKDSPFHSGKAGYGSITGVAARRVQHDHKAAKSSISFF